LHPLCLEICMLHHILLLCVLYYREGRHVASRAPCVCVCCRHTLCFLLSALEEIKSESRYCVVKFTGCLASAIVCMYVLCLLLCLSACAPRTRKDAAFGAREQTAIKGVVQDAQHTISKCANINYLLI
jgi:Ca2+/H+ antiporter